MTIGLRRSFDVPASAIAAAARRTLAHPIEGDAELWLARPTDDAVLGEKDGLPLALGLGIPSVRMGPGSLWVALLLPRPGALVSCDEPRVVNRYVRPILRALTRCGALAHYFGRDWISVGHRPAAWVGHAYDAATERTALQAVVAVRTPFADARWESFRDREPGTLESIVGKPMDMAAIEDTIVAAYGSAYERAVVDRGPLP